MRRAKKGEENLKTCCKEIEDVCKKVSMVLMVVELPPICSLTHLIAWRPSCPRSILIHAGNFHSMFTAAGNGGVRAMAASLALVGAKHRPHKSPVLILPSLKNHPPRSTHHQRFTFL